MAHDVPPGPGRPDRPPAEARVRQDGPDYSGLWLAILIFGALALGYISDLLYQP